MPSRSFVFERERDGESDGQGGDDAISDAATSLRHQALMRRIDRLSRWGCGGEGSSPGAARRCVLGLGLSTSSAWCRSIAAPTELRWPAVTSIVRLSTTHRTSRVRPLMNSTFRIVGKGSGGAAAAASAEGCRLNGPRARRGALRAVAARQSASVTDITHSSSSAPVSVTSLFWSSEGGDAPAASDPSAWSAWSRRVPSTGPSAVLPPPRARARPARDKSSVISMSDSGR